MNKIEKVIIIAEQVRKELEDKYGADNLYGKCIEASDKISALLEKEGIEHDIVEGWCVYDDFSTCSDKPYDVHTWIELRDEKRTYVDVTATQFDMFIDEEIPRVIVGKRPYYMWYHEPTEEEMEAMGW